MTRVAILGTGRMGSAIARRLAGAGHEVTVWNRTRDQAEEVGVGRVADTVREAVGAADVVVSSLTGPDALRAVYLGPDGAANAATDKTFVDMSTAGPEILAELEPAVVAGGGRLVAVPIIGAPVAVAAGQAMLLAGGDAATIDSVRPVLRALGDLRFVGAIENAPRLKLIANSMLAVVAAAAAELEGTGEAAGLDPADVFAVITRVVPTLEPRRAGFTGTAQRPTLFALVDLRKDLELAKQAFDGDPSRLPLVSRAREIVERATERLPEEDISALVQLYRARDQPAEQTSATSR